MALIHIENTIGLGAGTGLSLEFLMATLIHAVQTSYSDSDVKILIYSMISGKSSPIDGENGKIEKET